MVTEVSGLSKSSSGKFWIAGKHRDDSEAQDFAEKTHVLVESYAIDVVHRFGLCPFFHNAQGGLGEVCIVLDTSLEVDQALGTLKALASPIIHLVYPLLTSQPSPPFERFGSALAQSARRAVAERYVHASFHPAMVGGTENPHRLVGRLRQSPDPFVQFIPEGLSTANAAAKSDEPPPIERTFQRLVADGGLADLVPLIEGLRAKRVERDTAFAGFLTRTST